MINIEVFSKAGIGKYNEDYVLHSEIVPDTSLIIVCDGMGGLSYGADASRFIAQCIMDYMHKYYDTQTPAQSLVDAIIYANNELAKKCASLKSKMGASIALALLVGKSCFYTWLGDVRIYLTHAGTTDLLTTDHLAIEGNHSFLSRCINGREFRFSPEIQELSITSEDEILIATDGFYLNNEVAMPLKSKVSIDDDATIVYIKQS